VHLRRIGIKYKTFLILSGIVLLFHAATPLNNVYGQKSDSTGGYQLKYPLENGYNFPFSNSGIISPLLIPPPSNIESSVIYDPATNSYEFSEKIGSLNYRNPSVMSFSEYQQYSSNQIKTNNWQEKARSESASGSSFLNGLRLGNQTLDKVFGSEGITITPQGSAELIFGYSINTNKNPSISVDNQRNGSFIFKEKIMMNVTGAVGDKMEVTLNYNTEASFDFENKTKLEYTGKEDEIIKKLEAGDVTFSLPGTLMNGSQSIFGISSELQFGRLTVSSIIGSQESTSSSISVQGGAQQTDFEIDIDDYDINRHFFLSHFFRDNYNDWLETPQYIQSQVQIESIEVWVVNTQGNFEESRNVIGVLDLGEGYDPNGDPNFLAPYTVINPDGSYNQPADNSLNQLYANLSKASGIREIKNAASAFSSISKGGYTFDQSDYTALENARPLSSREYTVNKQLGYISLNSPLGNDEVLAVAYVYTYQGETKKVGELSSEQESPNTLILKLLKGTLQTPSLPNWDLMMKNVYAIGAYQVGSEDFTLDILYRNDKTGVSTNILNVANSYNMSEDVDEEILLKVLELDNLDSRNEPYPDGIFDFVEGVTINSSNGRVIFPLVEPFGNDLREKIVGETNGDDDMETARNRTADDYVYEELYDSTLTKAQQVAEKNKFYLKGHYQGSGSSDIQLNAMNIPAGSVKVTAGGVLLTENSDYTVDYTLGRVKILNQGLLESGTPINISLESNSLFSVQQKTLLGTHLDYKFSENFNVGGTIMRLNERPLTEKVSVGEESISNTMWGLNASYRTESPWLTTLVDKIPLIETKEISSISFDGEFAQLIPGQSKITGQVAYIDDFEAAQTEIELKSFASWVLASPPLTNDAYSQDFYNSNEDGIKSGYGRAKLSWYFTDPIFFGTSSSKPSIDDADINSHYQRQILTEEIFPDKDDEISGVTSYISPLNINYFPNERGPYNYNADFSNTNNNWAGIMREIVSSDFEATNIEYIEFWLLDPFLEDETVPSGGDLYFQLGEISEDILRDGYKTFENGFPETEGKDEDEVEETEWGYAPSGYSTVNAFSNDADARQYQDIGLEGLSDTEEKTFHSTFASLDDPSADNFEYYLGSNHDDNNHNIIERYKNYNGLEDNSPVADDNDEYTAANKITPDIEDINSDNTLNQSESYFQYRVSLRNSDFNVGDNYIVDKVEGEENEDGVTAVWYQFRIPISDYETKMGEISDFTSIRFMRMIVAGFDKEVNLRFATLGLVRGEWRLYDYDLQTAVPSINTQQDATTFESSSVNIEENGSKTPVNYVLPPGVTRATDPSQPDLVQLNEQSLLLKFEDLQDNDGRAVYKNTTLDIRQYENLEMYIHAEALLAQESSLADDEITAFIRIGSDYQNNYYEYEIPLKVTPAGSTDDEVVWPTENNLELELDKLIALKVARNNAADENSLITTESVYVEEDGDNKIKVKGNPSLSNIRQIMLGVRNHGDEFSNIENDGLSKSAEVWFNELRLTGFNNEGGWAANGRVQAQLADFGIINIAGATSTPGFGSIEQNTEERQTDEIYQIDISSNLELGKFFPEKSNVSIPLYVGYSNTTINPEYYPGDPDRKLDDVLAEAETESEKKEIKEISQDKTERSSINVTNIRWNKQFKKFKVFQPANLSASVLYSQTKSSDYSTDYTTLKDYGASLNYVYNNQVKPVTPFNKWKAVRKPSLRIIKDFNFNYLPSSFTFATSFDRDYQTSKIRNVYGDDYSLVIEPNTSKGLYWDRDYTLRWDFTRALKFNYTATNNAIIDEPIYDEYGNDYMEADLFGSNNQYWKDSVRSNILNGGRTLLFNQTFGLDYTLPLNKIPLLNWTSIKTSYNSTYTWTQGAIISDADIEPLGNTLKNSNTIKLQGSFNIKNLYNKVEYFKQLEKKYSSKSSSKTNKDARYKTVEYSKRTFINKDKPKSIVHKLGTENINVRVTDAGGNEVVVKSTVINPNKITLESDEDLSGVTVYIEGKIERGVNPLIFVGENSIRFLLGLKSVNLTYSRNTSTMLSGYLGETKAIGFDMNDYYGAPGLPFILGWQDENIAYSARDNDWLTKEETFNTPTLFGVNESFNYRTTFEPFKGFRIDFSGMRSHTKTTEEAYLNVKDGDNVEQEIGNKYQGGSYSRSVITIGTAFEKSNTGNNWASSSYDQLKENRSIISQRLSAQETALDPDYTPSLLRDVEQGYGDGFSSSSSEVLIYSFLSAYTKTDPNKIILEPFSWVMMPNWKVTFDGLSKLDFFQSFLKTITLSHSYKSTYTVGQYATNIEYFVDDYTDEIRSLLRRDAQGDFIPEYTVNSVSINEQLSPLIGFDMTWHNSLLTKFEIKKTRLLSLSLTNQQLTESRNIDYVFGVGFKIKEVPLKLSTVGGDKSITSDINIRFDFAIRENITVLRSLNEINNDVATTGAQNLILGLTADYVLSDRVNLQFYFDYTRNTPWVATYFPSSELSFGFSLRLTL
jgi:cell surface protein SprA